MVRGAYLCNPGTLATQGCTQLSTISSNSKGADHYKQVLVFVLLVLTQQGPLKAGFKRKLSELILQRSVLDEQREGDTIPNVRRRLETMQ